MEQSVFFCALQLKGFVRNEFVQVYFNVNIQPGIFGNDGTSLKRTGLGRRNDDLTAFQQRVLRNFFCLLYTIFGQWCKVPPLTDPTPFIYRRYIRLPVTNENDPHNDSPYCYSTTG